jgi:chemotaxis protein methyltransferase CheR
MLKPSDNSEFAQNMSQVIHDLVHQRTGHYWDVDKRDRLLEKLTPLVVAHGFDSLLDYYYLLKYGQDNEEEWRRVEAALAVNETYFWREVDQIRAAAEILVPELQAAAPGKPVRIWHAACATGEEPYSMAIALEEAGCFAQGPVEIIATDFNENALKTARLGKYRERSFRALPVELRRRYFIEHPETGYSELAEHVRSRVLFTYLNLVDEAAIQRMSGFQIIFCRNAFIYFSLASTLRVVENFHQVLTSPGYLCVAAAESLLKITALFDLVEIGGAFMYRK